MAANKNNIIDSSSSEDESTKQNDQPTNNSGRSIVWEYFVLCTEGHRKAICKTCQAKLKLPTGTTTPMFNHLKSKHPDIWSVCNEQKRKRVTNGNIGQNKRRNLDLSVSEKRELDQLLMEMVAIDLKPFSCVEDKGFKRVLKRLAPNYDPPCRTTFSRSLAPTLYHKVKNSLMSELSEDMKTGLMSLAFTTDCWTSRAGDSYISLTIHFLNQDFLQKNITLGMEQLQERHTGVFLHSTLQNMLDEWDITSDESCPIFFTTDNARNLSSAISQGEWKHIYCFAHTLQLALNDAKKQTPGLNQLLAKPRRIATHFHHSDVARRQFQEAQKFHSDREPLYLKQMVETRWNSEFEMLERMFSLRVPLSQVLANTTSVDNLSGTEWNTIEKIIKVLKPLYDATIFSSSSNYPTISMVIPLIKGITYAINEMIFGEETSDTIASDLATNIKESLEIRFVDTESDIMYKKAMFLDPRYKTFFLTDNELDELKKDIRNEILAYHTDQLSQECLPTREPSETEKFSFWDFMKQPNVNQYEKSVDNLGEKIDQELVHYIHIQRIPPTGNPLSWWQQEKINFTYLSMIGRRYLSIPCTSVESERLFSSAGDIVTEKRTSLSPESVSYLIFLYKNLK